MPTSENEKQLQIGQFAESYGKLKGELNHVMETLLRAQKAYQFAAGTMQNHHLKYVGGRFNASQAAYTLEGGPELLVGLLNHEQLAEAFVQQERLNKELAELKTHLDGLAPHLL